MKKQLLFAAAAAMVMMTSCNTDGKSSMTDTIYTFNYITGVSSTGAPEGTGKISTGGYKFSLDLTDQTGVVSVEMLPSEMGSTVFSTGELQYANLSDGIHFRVPPVFNNSGLTVEFKTIQIMNYFGQAPTDVSINGVPQQTLTTSTLGYLLTNYIVNGQYLVRTFFPDMVFTGTTNTSMADGSDPFTSTDILYRVYFPDQSNLNKVNVVIYNAKFAAAMPKLNILLENLDLVHAAEGLIVKGENVIPKMTDGFTLTPNSNFPFQKFELKIVGSLLNDGICEYEVVNKARQVTYKGSFKGVYLYIAPPKAN